MIEESAMAKLTCFVIMPYQKEFDPVFETARKAANLVPDDEVSCHWLKEVHAAGKITDDILESLHEADLCIADVTGNNPNVMWETGFAMALGKPTILIGQRIEMLPFDLKIHRVLNYELAALDVLQEKLSKAIKQTLMRYDLKQGFQISPSARAAGRPR